MEKIGIIGGGKWATAIAFILARNKNKVIMFTRNKNVVESVNKNNENEEYFPSVSLSTDMSATQDLKDLNDCKAIFFVIPTQNASNFCKEHKINEKIPIILCNKGIDIQTQKFTSQIIADSWVNNSYILSGPNFATEIVNGLPSSSSLAGSPSSEKEMIFQLLNHKLFRVYDIKDKIGAEICGAIKNVIAIACGISVGKGFGENAKAALITRGIHETGILIKKIGGNIETLNSMAGIGDIMLTCNSKLSRNMSYGYYLAKNMSSNEKTIEGIYTSKALHVLCTNLKISMPISEAIYNIIEKNNTIDEAISNLLDRSINNTSL